MAEATVLRNNAIVRNASVGTSPPHGPVKTGELPLVAVKMTPGGPQVQGGQQRAVQILPSKDANGAVATGGLPMVQVKMTQNGPQLDDGQNHPVVIKDGKHGAVSTGGLPMVQVNMTQAGPQVHTLPNVQGGPPQIPAAPPALSAPRPATVARATAYQGYSARSAGPVASQALVAPVARQVRIERIAAPQAVLPPVPEFSADQLMLCRYLFDKYLSTLRSEEVSNATPDEEAAALRVVQLAEATLATIDDMLVATAVRAEATSSVAPEAAAPSVMAVPTQAVPSTGSIAPAPSVSYVAGRVNARSYVAAGGRGQRNAGMAPRRTARSGLPAVIVKMDGQKAVVQNREEIEQAKAAVVAASVEVNAERAALMAENEKLRLALERAQGVSPGNAPLPDDGNGQG